MEQTLTEKLLLRRVSEPVLPGSSYYHIPVDLVLGHDATIALLIDRLKQANRPIFDPSRCFFAADHFAPPSTAERADILRRYLDFIDEAGIPQDLLFRGISHQLLVEDARCRPGTVICGADSHTTMAGALSCFATGLGSTDILALLLTGSVFLSIPDSIRIVFEGRLPGWLTGKDIALEIIRRLGEGGAVGLALEYHDRTEPGIPMHGRMTIANMAVEAGATNGVFVPDEILGDYLQSRWKATAKNGQSSGADEWGDWLFPDPQADYAGQMKIDVASLPPLIALPGSPANVVAVNEAEPHRVDQVFIGSCAGGRLEDFAMAARILRGKRLPPRCRLVVTPASHTVYKECLSNGVFQILADAGALITNASCGACGGIDKGLVGAGEVCVSTSNRNFRGRMGSPDGLIYLASPLTAAASALAGKLTDPREMLADCEAASGALLI
jgi:3-isopropylmalate/(R)-2-methylmalate dehydratase large subunit